MTQAESEFIFHETLASTNDEFKRLLKDRKLTEYSVVITAFQTAGKGQAGNSWESEKNANLTFSLLLKPDFLEPQLQFYISKIISLGIIDTLSSVVNKKVSIKWPNDIYISDKKVAGILIENSILGSVIENSVVGIGLNVNQEVFRSGAPNPVSLKQITEMDFDLEELLDKLLEKIHLRYHQLLDKNMKLIDDEYFSNLYRSEGYHAYKDKNGLFEAYIEGVDETGLLNVVDKDNRKRQYAFKEVQFVIV